MSTSIDLADAADFDQTCKDSQQIVTSKFEMVNMLTDDVAIPHRFMNKNGVHAFPHAVVLSSSGEPKYLLDTARKTNLCFKWFGTPPESYLDETRLGIGVPVRLLLEIEVSSESWREAKPDDFPGRGVTPDMEEAVICAQERICDRYLACDASVSFNDISLNVLSSQTHPRNRRLRFKLVPKCDDAQELVAYSLSFLSVSKTLSTKSAKQMSANPPGPTEHARIRKMTQEASERVAHAIHEGKFDSVATALKSGEFGDIASARISNKLLHNLRLKSKIHNDDTSETFHDSEAPSSTNQRKIEVDEHNSGVFDDVRDVHKDAAAVHFAFRLTLSDGSVHPFPVIWNNSTWDQMNRWASEEKCFIH